jgi:hypothetical protein
MCVYIYICLYLFIYANIYVYIYIHIYIYIVYIYIYKYMYIGSKAAHSCAPNCSYTSKVLDDHLIYFAVRPIVSGENITFSYIGYMPTFQRREELKESKDFLCECSKCDGIVRTYLYSTCKPHLTEYYCCVHLTFSNSQSLNLSNEKHH